MIHVLTTSNEFFAPGLCVALHSLVVSAGESAQFEIYVIDGGITNESWRRIEKSLKGSACKIRLFRLRPELARFEGLELDFGGSVMTYARLLAPELLDVPRLLYVDSDILFQRDMGQVWDADIGEHIIAATQDTLIRVIGNESADCDALALNPKAHYFNAGLMMIDMEKWRAERVSERTLLYLRENQGRCPHWDQSALNVILYERWIQLKPDWNLFSLHVDSSINASKIDARAGLLRSSLPGVPKGLDPESCNIHFVGPRKPWFFGCEDIDGADAFWRALELTEFRGWKPSRFTKFACMRRSSFLRIEDFEDEAIFYATDEWSALSDASKRDDLKDICYHHLPKSDIALGQIKVFGSDGKHIATVQLK